MYTYQTFRIKINKKYIKIKFKNIQLPMLNLNFSLLFIVYAYIHKYSVCESVLCIIQKSQGYAAWSCLIHWLKKYDIKNQEEKNNIKFTQLKI